MKLIDGILRNNLKIFFEKSSFHGVKLFKNNHDLVHFMIEIKIYKIKNVMLSERTDLFLMN